MHFTRGVVVVSLLCVIGLHYAEGKEGIQRDEVSTPAIEDKLSPLRDERGRTPLHLSRTAAEVNAIFKSLAHRPDLLKYIVLARDKDERTALHICSANGYVEVVKALFQGVEDHFPNDPTVRKKLISAQDKDGNTCLHLAVIGPKALVDEHDHPGAEELLKSQILKRDRDGRTVLHLCKTAEEVRNLFKQLEKHPDLMKQLLSARDKDERNALHVATVSQNLEVMKAMLDSVTEHFKSGSVVYKEFLNAQDKDGNTCLHLAVIGIGAGSTHERNSTQDIHDFTKSKIKDEL